MITEMDYVTENLNKNGLREGDLIILKPFFGYKKKIVLNRLFFNFISKDLAQDESIKYSYMLDKVNDESLHLKIELVETQDKKGKKNSRYLAKSLSGGPFYLNGCLVLNSFLEYGDRIEIGHNLIIIEKKEEDKKRSHQEELLLKYGKAIRAHLPVLLEGETGTGKSTFAKMIHEKSSLVGSFIHLNLSSFSPNLIESELFGHARGAFTGASKEKRGAFIEADNGTLFLDEIDSLPIDLQTKLLIFLDDNKVRAVGGSASKKVNIRLIFSSGSKLEDLVLQNKMRKDFYFRINSGIKIELNTLRENKQLIENFCMEFALINEKSISPKLIDFYKTLPWPGNFRQLKSHLEKKSVLSQSSRLSFDYYDENIIAENVILDECMKIKSSLSLKQAKLAYVYRIFQQCHHNYEKAAQVLAISVKSVRRLLKEKSLELDYL